MPLYKHILFADDLIDREEDAVRKKVKALHQMLGCQLSIVHAIELPTTVNTSYEVPTLANWQEELELASKERIEKISDCMGIPKECQHLRIGQPKHQILNVSEEIGADLIILGSHARHGLGLLILGSTANGVTNHAKCDVLAVRV